MKLNKCKSKSDTTRYMQLTTSNFGAVIDYLIKQNVFLKASIEAERGAEYIDFFSLANHAEADVETLFVNEYLMIEMGTEQRRYFAITETQFNDGYLMVEESDHVE
jgi:hypothetical protein